MKSGWLCPHKIIGSIQTRARSGSEVNPCTWHQHPLGLLWDRFIIMGHHAEKS